MLSMWRWVLLAVAAIGLQGLEAGAGTLEIQGIVEGALGEQDTVDLVGTQSNISGLAQVAPIGGGAAQYVATAGFGLLGSLAGAESDGSPFDGPGQWYSRGTASFRDVFRIIPTDSSLLGTPGSFDFIASVGGSGGNSGEGLPATDIWQATSSWNANLTFFPMGANFVSSNAAGIWTDSWAGPPSYTGDPTSVAWVGTVAFIFGLDITIDSSLHTEAGVNVENAGKAESYANFLSTLAWGGFSELRDERGFVLTASEYGIDSESQTDWSLAAVPEPSTLCLISGALAALWCRRRLAS